MSNNGWTCPKCGRVYSPIVAECRACNKKVSDAENRKVGTKGDGK